jgi:hypothetical protein
MIRHERAANHHASRKWSQRAGARSSALALEPQVFTWNNPRRIAASLKQSALRSRRRKSTPFRSAMAMLNFYINRAGKSLNDAQRAVLERAKDELRRQFGKVPETKQVHT